MDEKVMMTEREIEEFEQLKRIGELFCKARFVTAKDEKGRDELRMWLTEGAEICNIPVGLPTEPQTMKNVRTKLDGHRGAGVCLTKSAVNWLKAAFDDAGGCWKMEVYAFYVVLNATSVGYRRAWSRRPEGVYEMLDFLRSEDVKKLPRSICWDNYPNSVEWTDEKDLP